MLTGTDNVILFKYLNETRTTCWKIFDHKPLNSCISINCDSYTFTFISIR